MEVRGSVIVARDKVLFLIPEIDLGEVSRS